MTDAPRDNNQISVMIGLSNADGITPVPIKIHPTTHALQVEDSSSGFDLSGDNASRDNNGISTIMGVSSADGITPVPIYIDPSTGQLLIDSA